MRRADADRDSDASAAPNFTLTAGPTMVSPRVLTALAAPLTHHYDPAFLNMFREAERLLAATYHTAANVVLMQGGATLGLEAAARAIVRPGMRCLNLVCGVYASSFGERLRDCGADLYELRVPYDQAIDPASVEQALDRHSPIELVSVVHCETPSGIENPLGRIAHAVRKHGALLLADVVSTLGGSTLLVDEWNIDLAVASAQKCLAGPPGISAISVSNRAWDVIERNPLAPRNSYLSLLDWKDRWIDGGRVRFPHAPSVANLAGLHAALCEIREAGGVEASIRRHARAARAMRAGVRAAGLELWPRTEAQAASCVTAVRAPAGVIVTELLTHVRNRYGVMLSGGLGELAESVVRLGHMGPASQSLYPLVGLAALTRGLADLGVRVDIAAGAQALLDALSQPSHTTGRPTSEHYSEQIESLAL